VTLNENNSENYGLKWTIPFPLGASGYLPILILQRSGSRLIDCSTLREFAYAFLITRSIMTSNGQRELSCKFLKEVHSGDTLYPALEIINLTPQGDTGLVGGPGLTLADASLNSDSPIAPY
jgi:hypothetical protein